MLHECGLNLLDIICCNKKWSLLCCICRFLSTVDTWYSTRVISVVEQLLLTNRSLPIRVTHCMHLTTILVLVPLPFHFHISQKCKNTRFLVKVDRYSVMFSVLNILRHASYQNQFKRNLIEISV